MTTINISVLNSYDLCKYGRATTPLEESLLEALREALIDLEALDTLLICRCVDNVAQLEELIDSQEDAKEALEKDITQLNKRIEELEKENDDLSIENACYADETRELDNLRGQVESYKEATA
jgi:phage shock protein A